MRKLLLEAIGLKKSFGGIDALVSFDFSLFQGEICGIMGPNGSGKTVLFNLISGYLRPDEGEVYYGPSRIELTRLPPRARHALGIARTFQEIQLFSGLSVLENVKVGVGPSTILRNFGEIFSSRLRQFAENTLTKSAAEALAPFGDRLLPSENAPGLSLSYANRRRLEFARALAGKPALIMLDEPTAGMNPYETYELQRVIYHLRQKGVTFLIIEHKLFFLEDLADRLVVLAQGNKIAEGTVQQIREDPLVQKAYLGDTNVA